MNVSKFSFKPKVHVTPPHNTSQRTDKISNFPCMRMRMEPFRTISKPVFGTNPCTLCPDIALSGTYVDHFISCHSNFQKIQLRLMSFIRLLVTAFCFSAQTNLFSSTQCKAVAYAPRALRGGLALLWAIRLKRLCAFLISHLTKVQSSKTTFNAHAYGTFKGALLTLWSNP